jgi:hypothetical protein
MLYDNKIQTSIEDGDDIAANEWRFSQFVSLCLMKELGGSEKYPIENIENQMEVLKKKVIQ